MQSDSSNTTPVAVQALDLALQIARLAATAEFPPNILIAISALVGRLLSNMEQYRLMTPDELRARILEWRKIQAASHWQI